MTSENDFQAALDADPTDHHTRLVFADWLQDRGDPRAEGYRALGVQRLRPVLNDYARWAFGWMAAGCKTYPAWFRHGVCLLPTAWYSVLYEVNDISNMTRYSYTERRTRREAEDMAALAFARLPAAYRAELLKGDLT